MWLFLTSDYFMERFVKCGVGNFKTAPGTWGSVLGVPLMMLVFLLSNAANIGFTKYSFYLRHEAFFILFMPLIRGLFLSCLLLFAGVFYSDLYCSKYKKDDPKEVVIDEVAGQLFTYAMTYLGYFVLIMKSNSQISVAISIILPFILFRLFDIFKPWPINWIDQNIKGGWGIMLDDMIAAIFASTIYYALILLAF